MLSKPKQVLCLLWAYSNELLPKSPFTVTDGDGLDQYSLGAD